MDKFRQGFDREWISLDRDLTGNG